MAIKNVDNITQSSHYSSTYLCVYLTLKFENVNMIFEKITSQLPSKDHTSELSVSNSTQQSNKSQDPTRYIPYLKYYKLQQLPCGGVKTVSIIQSIIGVTYILEVVSVTNDACLRQL